MAMRPTLNYPAAQIVKSSATLALSTSASVVIPIPLTSDGKSKPAFVRIAVSAGAAHIRLGTDTSTSTVTSDNVITSSEALWLNTMGLNYVSFRQATASGGTAGAVGSVGSCEEGALNATNTGFVVG